MTNAKTAIDVKRDTKGIVDSGVFNTKLAAFVKSQKNQRDNLQFLIVAGLEQYDKSGNTIYLTAVLEASIGVRSLPTKAIKAYIQKHANVAWTLDKNGKNHVFKKTEKGEPKVKLPELAWYNDETKKRDEAKADIAAITQLKATYTRLKTALDQGKVKADQREKTEQALAALAPFVA